MSRIGAAVSIALTVLLTACTDSSSSPRPLQPPAPACHLSPAAIPRHPPLILRRAPGFRPATVPVTIANSNDTVVLHPGDILELALTPSGDGFQPPRVSNTAVLALQSVSGPPCGTLRASLRARKPGQSGVYVTYRCPDACRQWSLAVEVTASS